MKTARSQRGDGETGCIILLLLLVLMIWGATLTINGYVWHVSLRLGS